MDKVVLQKEAQKLFGGATIEVNQFNDAVHSGWDLKIVPYLDKELRFIRIPSSEGMAGALVYLKKIQQHLLSLKKNGAFGIAPIHEEVSQEVVDAAVKKKTAKQKETYICEKCKYVSNYPGVFAMHKKKHVDRPQSISSAPNDGQIYDAK